VKMKKRENFLLKDTETGHLEFNIYE